ncbi:acetyltransferase [Vibrio cholerae]|nr:acetyltransferase [Vibrio cholerae]
MVSVVVFKFCGMRCQPLRRALCGNWLPFVVLSPTLTLNIFV